MAKKRKRPYTNWGSTRKIDGKIRTLADYGTKPRMNIVARQLRKRGYDATVITGKSNKDCAVYYLEPSFSEYESEIGGIIATTRAKRLRGAILPSDLKRQSWDEKEEKKMVKTIKKFEKEKVVEKRELKDDIEPAYKLTEKGKEVFDYDPSDFE